MKPIKREIDELLFRSVNNRLSITLLLDTKIKTYKDLRLKIDRDLFNNLNWVVLPLLNKCLETNGTN
jgi:hypothetical protein